MDTYDFLADPRTLTMEERLAARHSHDSEQSQWLHKLQKLAEDPKPGKDFPAFLLATPPFHGLAEKLNKAQAPKELTTDAADELDWFCKAFADYLRTRDGEEFFPSYHG